MDSLWEYVDQTNQTILHDYLTKGDTDDTSWQLTGAKKKRKVQESLENNFIETDGRDDEEISR